MADLPYDGSRLAFGPLINVTRSPSGALLSAWPAFLLRRSYTGVLCHLLAMWVGRALPSRGTQDAFVPSLKRSSRETDLIIAMPGSSKGPRGQYLQLARWMVEVLGLIAERSDPRGSARQVPSGQTVRGAGDINRLGTPAALRSRRSSPAISPGSG